MPRLANVSEGQISQDECPALEVFMLSLWRGYLWRAATEIFVHIQKVPSLEKNIRENGKLLKLYCFPWRTHGTVLSLSHYRPHEWVQPLKKLPKRSLIHLYEDYSRRRMCLSHWHKEWQKETLLTHTKYTYRPFSVQEHAEILRSLATNTNIALNISAPKEPKWVCLKHCQSVKYRQYFRLLYVPLNLTY